jgi:Rrf2 family protein
LLFSSSCEYGIRALIHLAIHSDDGPCLVREIAEEETIPRHYLAKILQQLAGHGLVRSTKGPGGGFALAKDPDQLTVEEIINVLEPGQNQGRCVLGLDQCDDEAPCPLHDTWAGLRDTFFGGLSSMTLSDMAEVIQRKRANAG